MECTHDGDIDMVVYIVVITIYSRYSTESRVLLFLAL